VIEWRFGELPEDGEAWLKNPMQMYAYLDYRSANRDEWRRLMVVTKSWLQHHLDNVRHTGVEPLWAVIPTMLVLPDAEGEELRQIVDTVIRQGGFDVYAAPVGAS
jgi:hypothetical protein